MIKKILQHPVVSVAVTFIISYLLMFQTWYLSDFLIIDIPAFLGIELFSIMGEDLFITWFDYIIFISIWICGLIVILLFKSFRPILRSFSPKLKGNHIKAALIGGLSLGFGLNLLIALAAIATGAIKIHYVGFGFGTFVLLLAAVFIQSSAEELVARVFIYRRLRKTFPKWPAIAIFGNGVFFLLIHLGSPGVTVVSMVMMLLVSLVYSLIVYYFDSIWIPIVAHTTWNFTQNILLGLPNSGLTVPVSMFVLDAGNDNFAFDATFGIEGSVLTLIVYGVVCVGLYYFGRKKGASETNIWDDEAWNMQT